MPKVLTEGRLELFPLKQDHTWKLMLRVVRYDIENSYFVPG